MPNIAIDFLLGYSYVVGNDIYQDTTSKKLIEVIYNESISS